MLHNKDYYNMKPQILHDITREEVSRFELINYVMGSSMIKAKPNVTLDHFDQIQKIRESTCPKKGGKHIHAIGWRALEKQFTLLILKEKKQDETQYLLQSPVNRERLKKSIQEFNKSILLDLFSLGLNEYSQEEINEYKNQINWHE